MRKDINRKSFMFNTEDHFSIDLQSKEIKIGNEQSPEVLTFRLNWHEGEEYFKCIPAYSNPKEMYERNDISVFIKDREYNTRTEVTGEDRNSSIKAKLGDEIAVNIDEDEYRIFVQSSFKDSQSEEDDDSAGNSEDRLSSDSIGDMQEESGTKKSKPVENVNVSYTYGNEGFLVIEESNGIYEINNITPEYTLQEYIKNNSNVVESFYFNWSGTKDHRDPKYRVRRTDVKKNQVKEQFRLASGENKIIEVDGPNKTKRFNVTVYNRELKTENSGQATNEEKSESSSSNVDDTSSQSQDKNDSEKSEFEKIFGSKFTDSSDKSQSKSKNDNEEENKIPTRETISIESESSKEQNIDTGNSRDSLDNSGNNEVIEEIKDAGKEILRDNEMGAVVFSDLVSRKIEYDKRISGLDLQEFYRDINDEIENIRNIVNKEDPHIGFGGLNRIGDSIKKYAEFDEELVVITAKILENDFMEKYEEDISDPLEYIRYEVQELKEDNDIDEE